MGWEESERERDEAKESERCQPAVSVGTLGPRCREKHWRVDRYSVSVMQVILG